MTRRAFGFAVAALLVPWMAVAPASAAEPPYPVNYDFLENAVLYGALPEAPGSNRWDCKPTEAHPTPVVLVHGTLGSAGGNWGTMSAVLANEGYCVFALTYGVAPELSALPVKVGGMNRIEDSAVELRDFVDNVRDATGVDKVDIVGHSEGTVLPEYYAKFLGGDQYISKYVSLSPLWNGTMTPLAGALVTLAAAYGFDPALLTPLYKFPSQVTTGGPFITKLREGGLAVPGIAYTNIVTKLDELVIPYTSGIDPAMTNIVLQKVCPTDLSEHVQIPSSPNVARLVLNALDPDHAQPVKCRLVLPLNGFESTASFLPQLIANPPMPR